MSTHFPDVETIRSALTLAVRAPSVHNSQPWQWRVGDHSLHLYANPDLRLPHTDPDARDWMLSCGTTLNHCQVAFAPSAGSPRFIGFLTRPSQTTWRPSNFTAIRRRKWTSP